ncbi:MAG: alpha/beta hydrolase [Parachlamydiaceae bacterium]
MIKNINYRAIYNYGEEAQQILRRSRLKNLFLETVTRPFKIFIFPAASIFSFIHLNKKRLNRAKSALLDIGGESLKLQSPNKIALDAMYLKADSFKEKLSEHFEVEQDGAEGWFLSIKNGDHSVEWAKKVGLELDSQQRIPLTNKMLQENPADSNSRARPAALICPGRDMSFPAYKSVAVSYLMRGIDVMLFDYPGVGKSKGTPTDYNTKLAAETCYQYLVEEKKLQNEDILVHGHSLGGGIASDLAARREGIHLFLDRSFTSFTRVSQDKFPLITPLIKLIGPKIANFNNSANLPKVRGAVAIGHGQKDKMIPKSHIQNHHRVRQDGYSIAALIEHGGNIIHQAAEAVDDFLEKAGLTRGLF